MLYNNFFQSGVFSKVRTTFGPLFLILASPTFAMIVWYTCTHLNGSFHEFCSLCYDQGIFSTLYHLWAPYVFGTKTAWLMITIFVFFQLILMRWMPGKIFYGPITPKGNIPIYKANGVASFLMTMCLFYLAAFVLKLFSPTIIYDNFGGLIGALNGFSFLFCLFLYFKGKIFPSCTDAGSSGNCIFDYYWGTELYPRVLGWDIKMFTNCRFGMMSWGLIIISFAAKQQTLYGLNDSLLVATSLQLIYIFKFFCWETGYLRSLDIMYDRAGFYICWGCLVWVPSIYTSPTLYLVNHPNNLGSLAASLIFFAGVLSIYVNYQADAQRQKLRLTGGNCRIWGKKPEYTIASFITEGGDKKESLLLLSGWWGISRHFHYIPELLGAFFWTLPALFDNFLPYFYVVFLTILLFDRARRDDLRCLEKYGEDWETHCKKVRYKIIPFIY